MRKLLKCFFAFALGLGIISGSWIYQDQASAAPVTEQLDPEKILEKAKTQAKKGKVTNSQFGIKTSKDKIIQAYGQPDQDSQDGALHYKSRHLAFYLEKQHVSKITTQDPELLQVTFEQVEKVLGEPDLTEGAAGHTYNTYNIGKYQLVFKWRNVEPAKLVDVSVQVNNKKVLKETKKQAELGKVINSRFGIDTDKETIIQAYGQPDQDSQDGALHYKSRHLTFYLQKQRHLFFWEKQTVSKITTEDPELLSVTREEVKQVLGKPDLTEGAAGHIYDTYNLGQYQLVFSWHNVDPNVGKLQDVSVQLAQ